MTVSEWVGWGARIEKGGLRAGPSTPSGGGCGAPRRPLPRARL